MRHPQKLATGYSIERNVVQEFDVSGPEPKPLGRERQRLALVDADRQRHLPQDVGVGISQVLPVVVAAQDRSASLVSIEQPELHIHPAVQVGLGDLFIDGALSKGLSFLIETHSEHLVMRLQRRLREQSAGEASPGTAPLNPKDVSFVYLSRDQSGCVRAYHIGLTEQGKFDAPWPNGFFAERAAEVLPAAIRAQLEVRRKGEAQ
jgi:predicted ATPase